jgi:DNA-binding NtrC family response regulator
VIEMKRQTNVLVVDDEKTVCNSCRKILSQEGYKVDVAVSGEEALKKVKDNGFDVIITDWKMPRIDGFEVTRKIKEEKPNVVVIMITGYPSVDNSIKAIRSGVADLLTKPFTPEELSDAMIRALEKGQAVPADLVLDRLVEKGVVAPKAEPQVARITPQEEVVAPKVTALPVEEKKVGPFGFAFKSVLAPVFGRLFFVALGPLVIFTLGAGVLKAVLGKKPVS